MSFVEMSQEEVETNHQTRMHIAKVHDGIINMIRQLAHRADAHDKSKLGDEERPYFAKANHLLRETTYGTPEYQEILDTILKPALEHHYKHNSHHPQHYSRHVTPESKFLLEDIEALDELIDQAATDKEAEVLRRSQVRLMRDAEVMQSSVNHMTILDLLEMYVDWWAAGLRHADGDIEASIKHNRDRFAISDQLTCIFLNSIKELPGSGL